MVNSGIHIVEEVQVFRNVQPVESLVISHIQVRGGTSRRTPHTGHACAVKLTLRCLVDWGGCDSWVTPAQNMCWNPAG